MLPVIYDALVAVVVLVERKVQTPPPPTTTEKSTTHFLSQHSMASPIQQFPIPPAPTILLTLPAPPPPPNTAEPPASHPSAQPLPTPDSDTSEYSGSPAKRRRRGVGSSGGEGTSGGTAAGGGTTIQEVGRAISKSARIIAEAIQSSEEREEKRHHELLNLHQRRLQIEESKAEINRQGINGLVDAINKLANSMLALAGHTTQS